MSNYEYKVYVIRLKEDVITDDKKKNKLFRDANPAYKNGKPCYYVGYTSKSVKERVEQHRYNLKNKKGISIGDKKHFVQDYYLWTSKKTFGNKEFYNTIEEAKKAEKKTAEKLRKRGSAVWSN